MYIGYTTFYLSTHQLMDIWAVSTFWLLGMNNAAMDICVQVYRYALVLLDVNLEMELVSL